MAGKIRLHEVAKELGLTNKEALDLALNLGIGAKSHSSSIEEAQADRMRRRAERDGLVRDQQPEEPKPVKKSAAKKAGARPSGNGAEPEAATAAAPAAEAAPAPAAPPAPAPAPPPQPEVTERPAAAAPS